MISTASLEFLSQLKANNYKDWFQENRSRYDAMRAENLSLAKSVLEKLAASDPTLEMVEPKNCLLRINRDIRFSANKAPYKQNIGVVIAPYNRKDLALYYIHIEPNACFVGGGLYMPPSNLLKLVREEISYNWSDFQKIIQNPTFVQTYQDLDREPEMVLKTKPKGYFEDNPAIEFLKLKSFSATKPISDAALQEPDFASQMVKDLQAIIPLIQFINQALL
jgi:uncharacterized protein (TIGR02453 family)